MVGQVPVPDLLTSLARHLDDPSGSGTQESVVRIGSRQVETDLYLFGRRALWRVQQTQGTQREKQRVAPNGRPNEEGDVETWQAQKSGDCAKADERGLPVRPNP